MKLSMTLLAVLAAVLVTGCNTLNYSQYEVKGPVNNLGVRTALSAADRDAVKEIAGTVAAEFKMKNMTASSMVPNTVAYFVEIDVNNPMEIKVYNSGGQVLVDVLQSNAGGETLAFRQLKETMQSELDKRFGSRMEITPFKTLNQKRPAKAQPPAVRQ
jgi:hypothetical protein